jgi:hypothetical protein
MKMRKAKVVVPSIDGVRLVQVMTVLLLLMPSAFSAKNLLMICVDDMKSVAGCYGGQAITPHIDKLASESSLFFTPLHPVPCLWAL